MPPPQKIEYDKIIAFIRETGPTLPMKVAKVTGLEVIIASAALSDLASQGLVKISKLKIGGSPLYYLPDQEHLLSNFSSYLNSKDRLAMEQLQKEQILKDIELDPLTRVSLRNIKDFAKPITVETTAQKELFWKWHMLSNQQATEIIKQRWFREEELPQEKQIEEKPPLKEIQERTTSKPLPEEHTIIPAVKQKERVEHKEKREKTQASPHQEISQMPSTPDLKDNFLQAVYAFLKQNKIEVILYTKKKKGDHEFILSVPSAVGRTRYYCNAREKKSINEGDLSTAYVQGLLKKLPVLYLTIGLATKKTQKIIDNEYKDMIITTIKV